MINSLKPSVRFTTPPSPGECRRCGSNNIEPPKYPTNLITNVKTMYGQLGPPKSQPRKLKFRPKCEKIGQGTRKQRPRADKVDDLVIGNLDLLQIYGVLQKANEPIRSGDVIMAAKPFVFCLATSNRGLRCESCLQKIKLKVVCACKYAYYCSTRCKENDLDQHSEECFYIKRNKAPPASDTARFILRLLLKLRQQGERQADLVPNKMEPRKFEDLLDHYDDITQSHRIDNVDCYYNEIIRILGIDEAPDPDYFLECYGRMAINSFNVLDEHQDTIGTALYLGPSIMDHSCKPNACVSFDGLNIVVRSLIDRSILDFSEVFISYISLLDYSEHRQDYLKRHYYFQCGCERCVDKNFERSMFSVNCHDCLKGEIVVGITPGLKTVVEEENNNLLNPEPCSNCGTNLDHHSLDKYSEIFEIVSEKLNKSTMPMETVKFCLKLMQLSRFTNRHILFLKTTQVAFDNILMDIEEVNDNPDHVEELLESALFHGLNLINGYSHYSQHCWSHEGLCLLRVAEIEFVLGNNTDCEKHLKKAEKIINAAMGSSGGQIHLTRISQLLSELKNS